MRIPEVAGSEAIAADINRAVLHVANYPDYGDNQTTIDHLKGLAMNAPAGVTIEVEPVAYQTEGGELTVPLHRTDVHLGQGWTMFCVGGVHSNELSWRKTFLEWGNIAVTNPDMLRALGIGTISLLEAERIVSDRNQWHKPKNRWSIGPYLWGAQRGVESVEYGCPVEYRGHRFVSDSAGGIAAQESIQELKPDLIVPYHNAILSGPYVHVDNAPKGLVENLSDMLRKTYPLMEFGNTDLRPTAKLAPGVFAMPRWQTLFDYYAALGLTDNYFMNSGEDLIGYARRQALAAGRTPPVGLMGEFPAFIAHNLVASSPLLASSPEPLGDRKTRYGTFRRQQIARMARAFELVETYLPELIEATGPHYDTQIKEIQARVASQRTKIPEMQAMPIEDPDRRLNEYDIAKLTPTEFYGLGPLGLTGRLATMLRSPHRKPIADQLGRNVASIERRMEPILDYPRRPVRAQLSSTLLAAQAIARTR